VGSSIESSDEPLDVKSSVEIARARVVVRVIDPRTQNDQRERESRGARCASLHGRRAAHDEGVALGGVSRTTALEVARRSELRPYELTPSPTISMKTLMLPHRSEPLAPEDALPFGMTHPNDTPCPFAADDLPRGFVNTCCSCRTAEAIDVFVKYDLLGYARLLEETLNAEQVRDFAGQLRVAADTLEEQYTEPGEPSADRGPGGVTLVVTGRFIPCTRHRFEQELASTRKVADWYEKLGRLGFGVSPWY